MNWPFVVKIDRRLSQILTGQLLTFERRERRREADAAVFADVADADADADADAAVAADDHLELFPRRPTVLPDWN